MNEKKKADYQKPEFEIILIEDLLIKTDGEGGGSWWEEQNSQNLPDSPISEDDPGNWDLP